MTGVVPTLRFKQDDGSNFPTWKKCKFGIFVEEFKQNSTKQDEYEVLTSARSGLIRQKDYYDNDRITERLNAGFNIIPCNYMTYRSRSDNRRFYFNENNLGITGIISTYYPVFKIKNGINKFFIELLFYHQHKIGQYSVGTSQTVLSINELKKIYFSVPSLPEQQKIADFLSSVDAKIDAIKAQIEKLEAFKKGLLQQMFV